MMRAVLFTLLALSVRAAHYGHSSYLSGIPSYSYSSYAPSAVYGSGLLGSVYGTGLGHGYYGSGLKYGLGATGLHYGAGLGHGYYGAGLGHGYYGSGLKYGLGATGLHYGAGLGYGYYGSGLKYGLGATALHGGHAALTSAIRPSIYSSGYGLQNPSRAVLNRGQIISNAPGKMEFTMGGAGQRAQLGAIAGYGKPPVMKYAPRVPYSSGAMLGGGYFANEAPAKMEFMLGGSGFKTGAAALEGYSKPAIYKPAIGGPYRSGLRAAGGLAYSSVRGQAGFTPVQPAINVLTGAAVAPKYTPRVPYNSGAMLGGGYLSNVAPGNMEFVLGDTGFKTGAAALEGYNKPIAMHGAGMYGAARGQSVFSARKPAIRPFKVSSPITGAALPRISSRNAAAIHGAAIHGGAIAGAGHGQISFNQDLSRIGGQSYAGIKPSILSFDKLGAPVVGTAAHHRSGINAASLHSAGIGGISTVDGHGNILFGQDIAGLPGLHSSGIIPAAPALTVGGVFKPSTGNIHRANLIRKSGSYGLHSGVAAGPHFTMGQAALRKPGMNVASLDKMIAPAFVSSTGTGIDAAYLHSAGISGIPAIGGNENILFAQNIAGLSGLHSSGVIPAAPALTAGGAFKPTNYVNRANWARRSGAHGLTSGATGSHMNFNMGEAALRKPGMTAASLEKIVAPGIAARPFSPYGISGVSANIPAYGSSGIVGPAGISFAQDFSRSIGSQTAGVKPVFSIGDKLTAPRVAAYPRRQAAFRNTAGLISSPFVKPVSGALAYRAPKLPGMVSPSLAGSISQDGSIFAAGHAINVAEGHAMDFKQGTTIPGATSVGSHSSTGIGGGSHHGSAQSWNRMSGDKVIFGDGAFGDKSTILFHTADAVGAGNLMGDQGSVIELAPAGINSALSGQGMTLSRSSVLPAFPSFPASSHLGFSHVAREHATDKSIFRS